MSHPHIRLDRPGASDAQIADAVTNAAFAADADGQVTFLTAREGTIAAITPPPATDDPRLLPDDRVITALAPDAALVVDRSARIVLATPERRITVTNAGGWASSIEYARVIAATIADPETREEPSR